MAWPRSELLVVHASLSKFDFSSQEDKQCMDIESLGPQEAAMRMLECRKIIDKKREEKFLEDRFNRIQKRVLDSSADYERTKRFIASVKAGSLDAALQSLCEWHG